jgi:hypothetical protein
MKIMEIPILEKTIEDMPEDDVTIWRKEITNRDSNSEVTQSVSTMIDNELSFDFDITRKDLARQIWTNEKHIFEQNSKHLFAFQYDVNPNLAKKFRYATVDKFWIKFLKDNNPCYYEQLIPDRSCRPFYDFEFDKNVNKDKHVDIIYQSFIKLLFKWFEGKDIELKDEMLLVEDASSYEKCSRHIKIPYCPCYFSNVEQHKIDAEELKAWLYQLMLDKNQDAINCFVKKVDKNGKESEICVIDTSVYGKDRCFRTIYSDKYGQNRPLQVYRYKEEQLQDQSRNFQIFIDNIIQLVLPEQKALPIVKRTFTSVNAQRQQSVPAKRPRTVESILNHEPIESNDKEWNEKFLFPTWSSIGINAKLIIKGDYVDIHPDSKYCPIKGEEHKNSKTIVRIFENGNCTVTCRSSLLFSF